jgi:hypothetical protein
MTDWESVLPSSDKRVQIKYGNATPASSGGVEWVFMIRDNDGAKHHGKFSLTEDIADSVLGSNSQEQNIELVARRIEKIASDTIRQYVQEEMFSEHVED